MRSEPELAGRPLSPAEALDLWRTRFRWVLLFQSKPEKLNLDALLRDIHLRLYGELGAYQRHGPVVTFSQNPGRYGPGCIAGEHTDALLAEIGVTQEEAADLRAGNIVWSEAAVVVDEAPAETWVDPREPELVLSGRER